MAYSPIENYGVIGDMQTVALVERDGSIDWFCFPHFDSPSVFGSILDHGKGGRFRIGPADPGVHGKQMYWPETNVLITRFLSAEGVAELLDFMPVVSSPGRRRIVRKIKAVRGTLRLSVECSPAFDYARRRHETHIHAGGASFAAPGLTMALATGVPLTRMRDGVCADFRLDEGEEAVFVFKEVPASRNAPAISRIGVWADGDQFHIFIDGVYQASASAAVIPGGTIGVFARSAGENAVTVNFSELEVWDVSP
jgi:GH15 family glucan-1,4-alpha-glucosidase